MRGLNKVTLIGNLGKDPEVLNLAGAIQVAKFSIAVNESYRDQQGQLHTQTDWHSIVAWRGLAELAQKYLRKGSHLYVEGKLKNRSYEDKEGQKHYVTEAADRRDCGRLLPLTRQTGP